MYDELDRTSESPSASSAHSPIARLETIDSARAITLAEGFAQSRVLDGAGALPEALEIASNGERVAVVAGIGELAAQRTTLRRIAQARLGLVVHAIASHGSEDLGAFTDIGWGVLSASGPEDSLDLALVARRAAEDSGVPFVVIHALGRVDGPSGRAVAAVGIPQEKAVHAFVGSKSRLKHKGDPAHPSMAPASDRAFAERAPFALGSALREYGAVSGRRHDVFDKIPLGEAPLVLVGMGPVGDALFSATNELRARGYEVSAVHVSTLRPFPGPRLVKALCRALAITVLEPAEEPLSHGGFLARELKSAFTDALTWVPGFPGIGRIPKLFVGVTGPSFDVADLAAVCDNMLADERGHRSFSFADTEHALPRPASFDSSATGPTGPVAFRWVLDDLASADAAIAMTSNVVAGALGLRLHAVVTPSRSGEGATVDAFAARDHARGGMARRGPRLVLTTARGVSHSDAVTSLAPGGVLAVIGDPASIPDGAKTMVRERKARILPLPAGEGAAIAAMCAGAAVAVASRTSRAAVDGGEIARLAGEGEVGERARRAFEAMLDAVSAQDREGNGARPVGVA